MKKLVFISAIEVYNGLNIFCSGETCDSSTLAVSGGRMPQFTPQKGNQFMHHNMTYFLFGFLTS
jgi:hypothetical protein